MPDVLVCPQYDGKKAMSIKNAKNGKILPQKMDISIHSSDTPELGQRHFIFRSPAMRAVYDIAAQVAGSDASVLISGESGCGKELFARLIHTLSDRASRPFVPVNCGVLQGELFADKFFGHDPGAFTGAARLRKGAFELAGSGTLFLDEVGEIPPANQVDFLRVLEERSFKRMGGEKNMPFQARIVAATNRPLTRMVREGQFRADLFYRINVVPVLVPPLRERGEDIPILSEHMLAFFKHRYHRHSLSLHRDAMAVFKKYSWPGNVRELRNLMERLVLLASSQVIGVEDLPVEMRPEATRGHAASVRAEGEEAYPAGLENIGGEEDLSLEKAVREAEIRTIMLACKRAGGRKGTAANLLGISERGLRHKIALYGLKNIG